MDYLLYRLSDLPAGDDALLDAAERAAAEKRGDRYRSIRCVLKRELARRCGCTPQEVQFSIGTHGKLHFAAQPFNISHSGDLLCMAFHEGGIGVDIQEHRSRISAGLAKRIMTAEQYAAYEQRGCPAQEFFDCWCVAEALVKQAGDSIWNVHKYPYRYENGRIIPLFENAPHIKLFTPAPGFSGAVAWRE